jgi:hypothetical protein
MFKNTIKTMTAFALVSLLAQAAHSAPQLPAAGALPSAKTARLAHSPLPPKLRPGIELLRIRDMRQAGGGGCWSHCYNMFDECMGTSEKNICVSRVKTCMETCDRLSGITNPTQRADRR